MDSILDGIKVLDVTNYYAGPFCTMLLKNLGAEVIKVERIGVGDVVRRDAPLIADEVSGTFIILNRGKKSITLDMKTDKGRKIIKELAKKVDVLVREQQSTGKYQYEWNGSGFESGVYFYRLMVEGVAKCRKILLLK